METRDKITNHFLPHLWGEWSGRIEGALSGTTPLPRFAVLSPQGGQQARRAFTLIELLVVVLIIAILAAVALPRYQMAVLKSRIAKASVVLNAIEMSQNVYRLEHGKYASKQQDLDIKSDIVKGYGANFAPYGTIKINDSLTLQWEWRQAPPWSHICIATSPMAHRVCQSLGGQSYNNKNDTETRTYYRLP